MKSFKHIFSLLMLTSTMAFATGSSTKELNIDGIKVIYKKTPKEVISVRMFIKGGNASVTAEKQGLQNFAFSLATEGGTKSMNKEQFHTECDKIGAEISGSSTYDYGSINLNCIKAFWGDSWNLFTDAVNNPAFDQKEFELMQGTLIAAAKQEESDPDQHLTNIAMENVFKGRSYSKIPGGTSKTLEGITLEDIKKHYDEVVGKARIFIVVVGNVEEADLINKVKTAFAKMPKGTGAPSEARVQITSSGVYIEDRDIATNYLMGIMSAPSITTNEGMPMRLGMNILYDRYFVELRTKRSLSYAPYAGYNSNRISNPYNSIYISTLDPKQSIDVMVEEINKVKKEGFTEKELSDKKQSFLTRYFMGQETSNAQSMTLGIYELAGDWKKAESFTNDVNNATLKEVNTTFTKYTGAIKWTYLGKKDAVKEEDFKQTFKGNVLQSPY